MNFPNFATAALTPHLAFSRQEMKLAAKKRAGWRDIPAISLMLCLYFHAGA